MNIYEELLRIVKQKKVRKTKQFYIDNKKDILYYKLQKTNFFLVGDNVDDD